MGNRYQSQSGIHQKRRAASSATHLPGQMPAAQWLWLLLLCGAVILFPERPAWGQGFNLDVTHNGISGYAQGAPLGAVMDQLADQGGYTVFVDEKLLMSPTTFDLPQALPAEKAIQRMVHPHSYAMVFTKIPGRQALSVDQIKVYAKGSQSATFLKMTSSEAVQATSSYIRSGAAGFDRPSSDGVRSGMTAVRNQVKAPVNFTRSSMGFTGFNFKDRRRGPDYRRDSLAMTQAYAEHRQERDAQALRAKNAELQAARQSSDNSKSAHRSQRDDSIQQTMTDSNSNSNQ